MPPKDFMPPAGKEAMYFMIEARLGLDPDHSEVVEEQAIPLSQYDSVCFKYLKNHTGAFLLVHEISMEEYLAWVQKKTGYGGRKYGRRGQGERNG